MYTYNYYITQDTDLQGHGSPLRYLADDQVFFEPWRDFQQCGILTSVDLDQPVQPPFKFRNSKLRSVSSLILIEYSSD